MEVFYLALFVELAVLAVALLLYHSRQTTDVEHSARSSPSFQTFRNNYLLVYSLMMAGDWFQGPYIYSLYERYGFKVGDIGLLFIAGFGSSMVFGTMAGTMADRYGRRKACLMYAVSYSLSCLTKHSRRFSVLLVGRLLGGISTSLLCSTFESWLVTEHLARDFAPGLMDDIFSKSVFLGGGLMAILAGLIGNVLVEDLGMGPVAPFDAAIVVMLAGGAVILWSWPENYGKQGLGSLEQFKLALRDIASDPKITLLGVMQALFEASMYTFIFLWTPALSPRGEKIPHGMVFACFMTACMAGSALTGLLMRRMRVERYMPLLFAASALSLMVPFIFHLKIPEIGVVSALVQSGADGITLEGKLQLLAFCVFEGCVGVFWPSMMALRARLVPDEMRSTIINIFRMPLNLFVCLILLEVSKYPLSVMFGLCIVFLFACMVCQLSLNHLMEQFDKLPKEVPRAAPDLGLALGLASGLPLTIDQHPATIRGVGGGGVARFKPDKH